MIPTSRTEAAIDKSIPTPRLGAHPDLTGNYQFTDWIGNYMTGGGRRRAPTQPTDVTRQDNQTYDFELYSPSRFGNIGRPLYKPEFWDKVQQLDMWTNKYDPVMTCQPLGVPREGPPRRIYQSDRDVTFLYTGGDAGGGSASATATAGTEMSDHGSSAMLLARVPPRSTLENHCRYQERGRPAQRSWQPRP